MSSDKQFQNEHFGTLLDGQPYLIYAGGYGLDNFKHMDRYKTFKVQVAGNMLGYNYTLLG